ncbi:hypothetical protein RB601_003647 [Gaeumannomyces tritici]
MSNPFSYLFYDGEAFEGLASHLVGFTASTATLTDDGRNTPRTTDDSINTLTSDPANNSFQGTPTSGLNVAGPAGPPPPPEPTVLLSEIQQAAKDVSQLVGRFGYKMTGEVRRPHIKEALFANRELLRLPCLKYADNFACRVTKLYATQPIDYKESAPLLWWLWNELLNYVCPTASMRGCKLEFMPARETDIALPYTISINLGYKHDNNNIELTASYGGPCDERGVQPRTHRPGTFISQFQGLCRQS